MNAKHVLIAATFLGIASSAAFVLGSCAKTAHQDSNIEYYTCPMHHQIHMDHPGNCPICGMKLVAVYKDSRGDPRDRPDAGITISPERQQLMGLKTAKVETKPAIREIRTTGRAAFDPDLAVAQREYLEIAKNVPSLKEAARSNLRIKGMSEEEIRELRDRPSTNLYLPSTDAPVWIYATLFQDEMDSIRPGDAAAVSLPSDPSAPMEGTVKAVDPVVDAMTRSVRARILVSDAGRRIRPNTYVDVTLKSDLGESLLIPSSAVLDSGTRRIVFVRSGDRFETREVAVGPKASAGGGDDVVIKSGLSEGEEVVTGAAFLVDSESQLKAALP
ncbi:MAG TPA: efflux RND transporter periplasmic adaptor subunit [bacterium]|nr:efflux RND transporter periplasmic adaptor subunit [bacterium]